MCTVGCRLGVPEGPQGLLAVALKTHHVCEHRPWRRPSISIRSGGALLVVSEKLAKFYSWTLVNMRTG